MAIRNTTQLGDPLLEAPNSTVTNFADPKVKQVIVDLIDSMRHEGLVGMAAPQIGENYQIFVTEPRETPFRTKDQSDSLRVYINPRIVKKSSAQIIIYEGCGSVGAANLFGPVLRPKEVTVEAFSEEGKKFQLTGDGLLGRVIQHEMDHLNNIEFIQKVDDYAKLLTLEWYQKFKKEDAKLKEASKITKKIFQLVK